MNEGARLSNPPPQNDISKVSSRQRSKFYRHSLKLFNHSRESFIFNISFIPRKSQSDFVVKNENNDMQQQVSNF